MENLNEFEKYYVECLNSVRENRKVSGKDFDDKTTYAISMFILMSFATYLFFGGCHKWILIFSLVLLITSMLVNIFSFMYNLDKCAKIDKDIRETFSHKGKQKDYTGELDDFNKNVNALRYITAASMFFGVMFLIIYLIINA
ncbi:MAG: hypothetical protein LBJ63_05260 [Prevotellaceae bacterium]|jgi:amino acid transporter|nr:hypothetical protein [Prevotellaceae bacterium]